MTACKDGVLRVFDAASGTLLESLVGHVERAWDGLVHPSGAILSSGADGTVRVWDTATQGNVGRVFDLPLVAVVGAVPMPSLGLISIHPANGPPLLCEPATGETRPGEIGRAHV